MLKKNEKSTPRIAIPSLPFHVYIFKYVLVCLIVCLCA